MARRIMTEEERLKIAKKQWNTKVIYTSDEKYAKRAGNLTGPKTIEGRMRSLANLQVGKNKGEVNSTKNGEYVKRILNQEEQDFYFLRREDYLKDYDINGSADEITLHQVLMEEITYLRLQTRISEKPSLADTLDKQVSECTRRLNQALDNLGTLRKQRLKQDEKLTAISIGTVAQQFFREMINGNVKQEELEAAEEERKFLEEKEKRRRERESNTVDAEYEVVDDEQERE